MANETPEQNDEVTYRYLVGVPLTMASRTRAYLVSFVVWPAEGTWEPAVYELFRQYGRIEMGFEDRAAFVTFSESLERSGFTLREVETGGVG